MTATGPAMGRPAPVAPFPPPLLALRGRPLSLRRPTGRQLASVGLELLSVLGATLVAFTGFQLWVTDLGQQRAQRHLGRSFAAQVAAAEVVSASGTREEVALLSKPEIGEAVAVLRVPRIGLEQVVVEGSGAEQLRSGPGHLRSTPLPGSQGNAVVLGHRTIYGEPFRALDSLRKGDRIDVASPLGHFRYRVRETARVQAGRPDPVTAEGGRAITLVTSDPPYRSSGRLVVVAEAPDDLRLAGPSPSRPARVSAHEHGLAHDSAAWWPATLWGLLLATAYAVQRIIRRRWAGPTVWLVTAPVLLAVAFVWFEQLNRLLPSTI